MQTDNKIFEDLARMANGFAGTMAGMAREGEAAMRERLKGVVGGFDFVGRDEFEAVKAMAAAARDEADGLRARLDALERAAAPAAAAVDEGEVPTPDNPPAEQP